MKEIEFPKGVHVNSGAFGLWYEAPTCYCKPQKVTVYSDCSISFYEMSLFLFPSGKQTELYVRYNEKDSYAIGFIPGYIKRVYVDKRLSKFYLETSEKEGSILLPYRVTNLILNGKNTKLSLSPDANKVLPHGALQRLYTVKGAKSIKEAKKYEIPIYWKTAGKAKTVKGKKKKGGSYHFIKTTKKRSIKSEYKYIRAVPYKEWE